MDVLLTHGFYLAGDAAERRVMRPYPPLGILYISSHLKARGMQVQVFDSTFAGPGEFEAVLARERPPIVGIAANLLTRRMVVPMMAAVRASGAIVVVGGPDPANYAGEYLAHGANVVVLGEGELTMEELVPHLGMRGVADLAEIAGIAFSADDGSVVRTPPRRLIANLDAQPFPDRVGIDTALYVNAWRTHHGLGSLSLITARGCPYTCRWCSHSVFGYTHRRRSPGNVAEELEMIVALYRPDMVWYADDVFTIHTRWLADYAAELKRRNLRVPFETISREDRLNEATVATLAEMGCLRLWIGSESGSQRVMDAMSRGADVTRVRDVVRLLQRHGIEAGLFVMLGYEGEDVADIEATVAHLKACRADRLLTTIAYPIKGTPYFADVSDRIVETTSWREGSDRDLSVRGRHSRRFYEYATRWLVGEVSWQAERHRERRRFPPLARAFVNARVGRIGMRLTEHQREGEHA